VPRPDNHVIVVSGATGDLAHRKLLPGLFHLATAGLMPDRYQIIGVSPQDMTGEQFRELARQAIADFGTAEPTGAAWQAFQRRLSFASADPARTLSLVEAIAAAERQVGGSIGAGDPGHRGLDRRGQRRPQLGGRRPGRRHGGPPAGRHRHAGQDGDLRPRAVGRLRPRVRGISRDHADRPHHHDRRRPVKRADLAGAQAPPASPAGDDASAEMLGAG